MAHKLLLVDDEPDNLDLLARAFHNRYQLFRANSGMAAMELLRKETVDMIITDFRMPGMDGVQLLEEGRKINPHMVRVILTGFTEAADIIAAINRGEAHRYLTKPFRLQELLLVVQQAFEAYDMRREREQLVEKLQKFNTELEGRVQQRTQELQETNTRLESALEQVTQLARTDATTGLWNRRYFLEMANRELARARRFKHPTTLMMLEVFQNATPTAGRTDPMVYEVMSRTVQSLRDGMRGTDVVSLMGPAKFAVLMPETTTEQSLVAAHRILNGAARSAKNPANINIGCATYPAHAEDLESLMRAAENSMGLARGAGGDRVAVAGKGLITPA